MVVGSTPTRPTKSLEASRRIEQAGYALIRENAEAPTHSDLVFAPAERDPPTL